MEVVRCSSHSLCRCVEVEGGKRAIGKSRHARPQKDPEKKMGKDEKGSDQSGTVTPVELAGACILQERKKTRKSGL